MVPENQTITHKREGLLFILSIIVSLVTFIILFVTIIGIPIFFGIALATIISHAISIAYIRLNGIELSSKQFGDIYRKVMELSEKMKLNEIPEAYIVESGGILNAFASRIFGLFGKNIVVLYSDIVELVERGNDEELEFIIAHELTHIKRNHIVKRILTFPAMWIPFLGEAYSRACEFTADKMAITYTERPDKAVRALTVLAAGKHLFTQINVEEYLIQYNRKKGLFITLTELISTHPALPRRIFEIEAFIGTPTVPLEKKSKLSLIVIILSIVLSSVFLLWAAGSFMKDTINYFTEPFYPGEPTELMDATIDGDTEELSKLLKKGADPNEQEDEFGSTALIVASDNDQMDAAKILLEHGADPNLGDFSGYTPLMEAVFMENKEMIQLLLEHGADPNLSDSEGMTAIDHADDLGLEELAKMMDEYK